MYEIISARKIVAGPGALDALGKELKDLGVEKNQKVLIVTDKGIVKAGIVEKALKPIKDEGISYEIFDEIEANPKDTTINKGADYIREINAKAVVGIGGGSAMDSAKAIAALANNEGTAREYFSDYNSSFNPFKNPAKKLILVATTSGTGAEVTPASVITDTTDKTKRQIFTWQIVPEVAITDPLLTLTVPPHITAGTGMDAFVHAAEAYVSINANPFSDVNAYQAMKLIIANLRKAYVYGNDVEARTNMMIGSTLAARAFANVGLGIVHSIGQAIGGEYDAPHGLTMAVCLPITMEFNFMSNPKKFAEITKLLGKNVEGLSELDAARLSADAVREMLNDVDIPENIRAMGVTEDSLDILAEKAKICACTDTNPRVTTMKDFKDLFGKLYSKK